MDYNSAITHLEDDAGYHLSLDGREWVLTGHPEVLPWLHQLAAIMRLGKGRSTGRPRIHFYPRGVVPGPSRESDWTVWEQKGLRFWFHDHISDVLCEVDNSKGHEAEVMNMWYALHPIYWGAIRSRGLPLHGALIEREGQGVVLAAPGGTGKSTCCRRIPEPWLPRCDDELLVLRDERGRYRAHPFPTWSDYLWHRAPNTWNVESSIPLQAVFFLSHAEREFCEPLSGAGAAMYVNDSAEQVCRKYWHMKEGELRRAFTGRVFANACEMVKTIPCFKLGVSLDGRFWEEMERALEKCI